MKYTYEEAQIRANALQDLLNKMNNPECRMMKAIDGLNSSVLVAQEAAGMITDEVVRIISSVEKKEKS